MLISWTNTLETGISSIDNERKRLIELANLFGDEQVIKEAIKISPHLLDGILPLFKDYFDNEEDLMFKIDYPEADKHLLSHSVMTTSLEIAIGEYKTTGSARLIADFISETYVGHLKSDETSLASFIQKKRRDQAARPQKGTAGQKGVATKPHIPQRPPLKA